jgi:PEGA domain
MRPVKERILAVAFTSLLLSSTACSQNVCPIEVQKVDPKSYPLSAGLLGDEKDLWDRYLRIEYKNTSGKSIVAIRFGVEFINSLAEAKPSV